MTGPIIWDEKKKTESKRLLVDPITRLEGHGKIEIFLDDNGDVENCYWQVPELRGFERFCIGRKVTEMNQITARLCGVCPGAHHLASTKAIDGCFGAKPTPTAFLIRDLFYHAHFVHSHIAHFYALAAPDFVCGPGAPSAERNVLGVVGRVGLELGGAVLRARSQAQRIQAIIGGKATHPVMGVAGGVTKAICAEEQKEILQYTENLVKFAQTSMEVLKDVVLKNNDYVDIIKNPDLYYQDSYYMGLVNDKNQLEFHDGPVRVKDPMGNEFAKYDPYDYLDNISEAVEPWSYEKFPYLKKVGYKGLVTGMDSGIYRATPLSRINVCDSISTPLAQEALDEFRGFFKDLGVEGPVHFSLATHWARIIELIYAAEKANEDAQCKDARLARDFGERAKSFRWGVLGFGVALLGILIPLALEKHLSAIMLMGMVAVTMMFIAGTPTKWIALGAAGAVIFVAVYVMLMGYAGDRITAWIHPEADPGDTGYQILQSLYAIGSGGLYGLGLGKSKQKYLYLPFQYNDYIFAIVCEELGFLGAGVIVILFSALILRGYWIALRARDRFSTLLCAGLITLIAVQTILNFGVVTNLLPSTGIALPFFSYGGTALAVNLGEMGIVLQISRHGEQRKILEVSDL